MEMFIWAGFKKDGWRIIYWISINLCVLLDQQEGNFVVGSPSPFFINHATFSIFIVPQYLFLIYKISFVALLLLWHKDFT